MHGSHCSNHEIAIGAIAWLIGRESPGVGARDSRQSARILYQCAMALQERFRFRGEITVDGGGGFASFRDGPDNEGLAAAHIAGGKDAFDGGHVVGVGGDVAAAVESDAELLDHARADGAEEAHGQ